MRPGSIKKQIKSLYFSYNPANSATKTITDFLIKTTEYKISFHSYSVIGAVIFNSINEIKQNKTKTASFDLTNIHVAKIFN